MTDLRAAVEGLATITAPAAKRGSDWVWVSKASVLALIPEDAVLVTEAKTLGYAMDLVDEEDAVFGVVGRGTKAERILARLRETP
jgi:hypothetical protein